MSEMGGFAFGSVPIYNPQSLSKEEALAQFHARRSLYQELINILGEERPSHVLLIGARGMGKTTLLQRVRYGVEDDPILKDRYLVLAFPEEQYSVNRLHHFLLNMLDALADAFERLRDRPMLRRVEEFAEKMGKLPHGEIEELVPGFMQELSTATRRSLLMLVDNADRLFDTLDASGQWRLRELLSKREDLTLFGATTQASEGIYAHDRAFFEFFKIYSLGPLKLAEVKDLLLRLSESVDESEVDRGAAKRRVEGWLAADAARLRTLVQLTGGNPRTTVLLFHLVLGGLEGGAREYLEQLLDQCTPNYKGRVDELPSQAQQVLDAVALRWDPVTAAEIAEDTGLETSVVSTQLTRLVRQGLLEKADPGDVKKALYQVAERFFNIWYLMRATRRARARLRWFVEFLRVFFDPPELERMAWDRLKLFRGASRTRSADFENAFAYVLASGTDPSRIEEYLRRECADLEPEWRPFVDSIHPISGRGGQREAAVGVKAGDNSASEDIEGLRKAAEGDPLDAGNWTKLGAALMGIKESAVEAEKALRRAIELDPKSARAWRGLGYLTGSLGRTEDAENAFRTAIELAPESARSWDALGDLLASVSGRTVEAEAAYRKATEVDPGYAVGWADLGHLLSRERLREGEAEVALRRAVELAPDDAWAWLMLGDFLWRTSHRAEEADRSEEAEAAYRKAIELDSASPGAWAGLGIFLRGRGRKEEAEAALRRASELSPASAGLWTNLGDLLAGMPGRRSEAEGALRKAVELGPEEAWAWDSLGMLLARLPDREAEAEAALRQAGELCPDSFAHWANLGGFLSRLPARLADAEHACRKAIDLAPTEGSVWDLLGDILSRVPDRWDEAEAAYRKALELDPVRCRFWVDLASQLAGMPGRTAEAEAAYRKAIELHPASSDHWGALAAFLGELPDRIEEAGAAYREALRLNPDNAWALTRYGFFLACRARRPNEAESALRRAAELRPTRQVLRNLGVLLFCELNKQEEGLDYLSRAYELKSDDRISAAVLAACVRSSHSNRSSPEISLEASRGSDFWEELVELCENYAPFGKILRSICDIVEERDQGNPAIPLHRAVALAQLGDFPRASVAFEDALNGDPIDRLATGRAALDVFLAAAVRNGRVRDCLDVLDKKEWKDAWRPIYEALMAVEAGSAEYLRRVAVEIREPATLILRRLAPQIAASPST